MCIYIYTYIYRHAQAYVCNVHVDVHVHVCGHVSVCICICIYVDVYCCTSFVCIHECIECIYTDTDMYLCMFMYGLCSQALSDSVSHN